MSVPSLCRVLALLGCLLCAGCFPVAEGRVDEQKNPYFLEGRKRIEARDYKGAIEAFERALEVNPRSALAHFELGVLYEQYGDQTDSDYVTAMYHYLQAMKIRPNVYPFDNARLRVASCKQELVKAESLAPVYQSMHRELQRLKEENQQFRKQLEALGAQTPARVPSTAYTNFPLRLGPTSTLPVRVAGQVPATAPPSVARTNQPTRAAAPSVGSRDYVTPLPSRSGGRTHTVRSGETLYSIARRYGVRLDALQAANPGITPKSVRTGQTLAIP